MNISSWRCFGVFFLVVFAAATAVSQSNEAAELPVDAAAAQAEYTAQRKNGLLQLNQRYLEKLEEILVNHTKAGRLNDAVAVRAEVNRIKEEIAMLKGGERQGGLPPLAPTVFARANAFVPVEIKASAERGTVIEGVQAGDKLVLSYRAGRWKSHGVAATEDPDSAATQHGEENRLAVFGRREGATKAERLVVVPPGTVNRPYEFVVPLGYREIFLRVNEDPDGDWRDNPGAVTYEVGIAKPLR